MAWITWFPGSLYAISATDTIIWLMEQNKKDMSHMWMWHWWITLGRPIKLSIFKEEITIDCISDLSEMQMVISRVDKLPLYEPHFQLRPAFVLHTWNIALYDILCRNVFSSPQQEQERWTNFLFTLCLLLFFLSFSLYYINTEHIQNMESMELCSKQNPESVSLSRPHEVVTCWFLEGVLRGVEYLLASFPSLSGAAHPKPS